MTARRAAKDRWQALADQATKQLRVAPVTVVLVDGSAAEYVCLEQQIKLATQGNTRWALGHELGHHILAHCGQSQQQEREANAIAVQVRGASSPRPYFGLPGQGNTQTRSRKSRLPLCARGSDLYSRSPQRV